MDNFEGYWFDAESQDTTTSRDQCSCEQECANYLRSMISYEPTMLQKFKDNGLVNYENEIRLVRSKHIQYLLYNLTVDLPSGFVSLDASRPWICYWITHALYLLGKDLPEDIAERVISTLRSIQNRSGGFGGSPQQISQGAPNYAAVLTLCSIGTMEALQLVNRPAMYNFFRSIKHSNGGFCIHVDGEVDSRGTYTIIAIARLLNILTDELVEGTAEFLLSCQTYEGGFGGEPGNEAHGGYNFCAVAALLILKQAHKIDLFNLENWLLKKQVRLEGGFQGRTNKLVDSCYTFWQGAALALVEVIKQGGNETYDLEQYLALQSKRKPSHIDDEDVEEIGAEDQLFQSNPVTAYNGCLPFNQQALQRYVLHCAQNADHGGMRDKPGKTRDFYHSCYSLSGLAVSQSSITCSLFDADQHNADMSIVDEDDVDNILPELESSFQGPKVYGDSDNLLQPTSLVFNIGLAKLKAALDFYSSQPTGHSYLMTAYQESLI